MVLPALNLFTLDAGILIRVQQVILMMFSLIMVEYSMSFLLLAPIILVSATVPLGLIWVLN